MRNTSLEGGGLTVRQILIRVLLKALENCFGDIVDYPLSFDNVTATPSYTRETSHSLHHLPMTREFGGTHCILEALAMGSVSAR